MLQRGDPIEDLFPLATAPRGPWRQLKEATEVTSHYLKVLYHTQNCRSILKTADPSKPPSSCTLFCKSYAFNAKSVPTSSSICSVTPRIVLEKIATKSPAMVPLSFGEYLDHH